MIQTNGTSEAGGTFVMKDREIREKSTLEKRGLHWIQRKYSEEIFREIFRGNIQRKYSEEIFRGNIQRKYSEKYDLLLAG